MGKKKNYKLRTGARTASKGLEKELKRKAKRLSQDPTLALPRCTEDVPYFKKIEKGLRKVQSKADDRGALEKLSKKGDRLVRAYAGTLMLLHEDKIQYLAVFKTPFGDTGYALRGSTSKEKLVGVQNYDQPRVKLLAYLEEVKKKKLYMFVTDEEVICTGKDPTPPKEVVKQLPSRLGKGMKRKGDLIISGKLKPDVVKERRPWKEPYIVVSWGPAGIEMARPLTDARQNEDNIYATCASYMAAAKISEHFDVEVVARPVCDREKECPCRPPPAKEEKKESFLARLGKVKPQTDREKYLEGKLMDHRLIEKERAAYEERLKEIGNTVYIISNRCHGDDKDELLSSLKLDDEEKEVMEIFLDLVKGPIISEDESPNLIMTPYWEEVGKDTLKRLIKDSKTASGVFKKFPVPRYQPMTVVHEAKYQVEERRIRKVLPEPKDPPEMIRFAYDCAIAYLVRGEEGASKVVDDYGGEDIKLKAAKYAFVKSLGLTKSAGWSYTTHEVGYAQGLDEIVDDLVSDSPVEFEKGLKALWKATGSTKDLEFK